MKIRFALLAIIIMIFLIYPLAAGAQDRYVLFRSFPEGSGLDNPYDLAVDSTRNVYVADTNNDRIQKFSMFGDLLGGWGSGDGKLNKPRSLAIDKSGNVYVTDTDNHKIQKFSSNGAFIAKWGKRGSGNGEYFKPGGIAIDGSGYMYIADTENHRIQKLSPNGDFVTKWGSNGSGDGKFSFPEAISVDSSGNVYVVDINNRRIQKFDSKGNFLMKLDKIGLEDGKFIWPRSVANDSSGNLYVTDGYNGRIQKFDSEGKFLAKWGTSGTGDGQYLSLRGIEVASTGEICVTDCGNNRIHILDSSGMFLSKWGISGSGNGQFLLPKGLARDSAGNVYVADMGNNRIQKLNSNGDFILKWGSIGSGDGQFLSPSGVAVDKTGNIYVVDWLNNRIQKFDPYGVLLAKLGSPGSGDGQFMSPFGIAIDTSGNIYVADWLNHRIQKFDSNGIFLLKWGVLGVGNGELNSPRGIAIDLFGSVYVTDTGNSRIQKFSSNGDFLIKWGSVGSGDGQFTTPWAVATDTAGNVYVSDYGNHRIQKFDSNGRFLTKWGAEGNPSDLLRYPYGIMVDDQGDVFVADAGNQCIRKYRRSAGNTQPTANSKILTTFEDTPTQIVLSGRDPDGDALSYRVLISPTHGTLSGSPPNLTYTPKSNYSGSDSLVFTVRDASVESPPAVIQINIIPVNDPPIADSQTIQTDEDTLVIIALTASDPDNDKLTYYISEEPENGTLSGDLPTLTYTPKADFSGTDSFTFFVSDGVANSEVVTVNITISSVNDPPIANSDKIKVDEDSSIQITLKGSDPEGEPITFEIVSNPSNGKLTGIIPNLTYTPTANYSGTDSFTFKVNDGSSDSPQAKIDITVNPINDKPTVQPFSFTTKEDTNYQFTLKGEDLDNDTLTFNYSKPPHGFIFGTSPNFVYKPDANYFGSDSFTYTAEDGTVKSDPAIVTVTVESVNDPPVANPQTVRTPEDTPLKIILTGIDIEKDPLSFRITVEPSKGILEGTPPEVTYKPNENFNGKDSFKFVANDGQADSQPVAVEITIDPVNDPPTADPKSAEVLEGGSVEIVLTGSDIEKDNIIFKIMDPPTNGVLNGSPPVLMYNPKSSFFGSDSFTYVANDGNSDGEPVKVSITIKKVNVPPFLTLLSFFTDEDTPVRIELTGSDPNNDALTFKVTSQPSHGTLEGEPPILTYTPSKDFNGNDGFEFIANDGEVDSNIGTAGIWVKPVNDPPALKPQSVTTDEDTPIKITLSGIDIDSPKVTNYRIVDNPLHGIISGKPPEVIYTPSLDFNGDDSFTFTASDEKIDGEPAKVSITVKPVNDPPTAVSQSIATNEDTPVKIALTGSDIDGDSLTFKIANQPKNGTLEGKLPELFYKPNTDFNGDDSFTFIANDGTMDSQLGIVFIKVQAINDTPVADAQSVTTDEDTPIKIILTGKDVEGSPLTFKIMDQPKNGILEGKLPDLTYKPNPDFNGEDGFTFAISDGELESQTAKVSIKINAINDPPIAEPQNITTDEDTPIKITLTAKDIEGSPLTFKIMDQPKNGVLEGELPNLTYKPNPDFNGEDGFTFIASDGELESQTAKVSIKINPINDLPVAEAKSLETDENKSVTIKLSGKDVEGDTLVFKIIDQPKNGTIKGTPPDLTYEPNYAFGGDDSFTYLVNDGKADSEAVAVNIKVQWTPNPYDVNRDGIVNILDIIFVSKYLGKTDFPLDNNPDVNRDKKVDNKDIDVVIQNFGRKP
jgi:streptogramin lyase